MNEIQLDKKLLHSIEQEAREQDITVIEYIQSVLNYAVKKKWKVAVQYNVLSEAEQEQIVEDTFNESVEKFDEALRNLAK